MITPKNSDRSDSALNTFDDQFGRPHSDLRLKFYTIIFEADTRAGRMFDLCLLIAILFSTLVVMLDSVNQIRDQYGNVIDFLEWGFTAIFTLEYLARLWCVRKPLRYAFSFFGVIDLLSIVPAFLALLFPQLHVLLDIRILRLLRLFRILKLVYYVQEYRALGQALAASRRKILIFLSFVMLVVFLLGTIMYVVEGPANGFTSIPTSIYWAITTVTTVGFGDITPKTDLGRMIASFTMLIGWGILAVPTGIISAELSAQRTRQTTTTRTCHECLSEGHSPEASYCQHCGAALPGYQQDSH